MSHAASIDSQLFELFDCVEEYQQLRSISSSKLRQAFFDLALAKRSAGYQWISPDMYSGRAHAIATVVIDEEHPNAMQVVRRTPAKDTDAAETTGSNGEGDKEGRTLRRRGGRNGSKDAELANSTGSEDKDEAKSERNTAAANDPLQWFGMLVPPSLKEAQSGFASSLDYFVQLAQLKRRLIQQQQAVQQALAEARSQQ
ncbi:hypothetical protein GGI20_001277 [Coemansia sp. BCRC 34301]|nr:hypothetical protein GGI20_001277 [Coemansia sp. BCRC 34301]